MEEGGREVGGVRAAAGAVVGHCYGNAGAHHRQCVRFVGWAGA